MPAAEAWLIACNFECVIRCVRHSVCNRDHSHIPACSLTSPSYGIRPRRKGSPVCERRDRFFCNLRAFLEPNAETHPVLSLIGVNCFGSGSVSLQAYEKEKRNRERGRMVRSQLTMSSRVLHGGIKLGIGENDCLY